MSRFSSTVVTNKPSSVYFGKKSGDNFPITESVKYAYDSMGNISRIDENGEPVVWYKYDALNRLVREDNKTFGKTWLYSYDNKGNILSKRETSFTLKENTEESEFTRVQYEYDGDKLLTFGTESCEYDAIGNPTTYRGKTVQWSNGRQMVTYDGTAFTYDGLGRRLSKGDITYTYDSNNRIIKQSNGIEFIYDNSGVAGIVYNNATYVYRKDGQGNIAALIDSSGNVVVEYKYDAWGDHVIVLSDSSNENLAKANPFRYRGYYYDEETGLYYLKSRYYDPETGRFLNADDISYLDPETINGLNFYAYCGNNPVMRVDANGNAWWDWLLGIVVIVAAVGLSIMTAGLATPISAALGGGLFGSIVGGAVAGAVGGAIASFGISVATQGMANGFSNINWAQAANETLKGAIFGAILGGVVSGTQYLAAIGSKTKEVGTYILRNAEGKVKYVGKGSYERMLVSLNKKGLATGQFIKASDETMAFIREALFIDQFGGAQSMGGILKNLINSPGLKFLFWWL